MEMSSAAKSADRQRSRDKRLAQWGEAHRVKLERLDEGQKWVVFAALGVLAVIGGIKPLKRLLGYFLAHCGMGLSSTIIGALIGVSDRNVRYEQRRSAEEVWQRVSRPARGHRPTRLAPEHVGIVAKYLVEHPGAKVQEIIDFLAEELGVTVHRHTLRRYIQRYGLGCLRDGVHEDAPLF